MTLSTMPDLAVASFIVAAIALFAASAEAARSRKPVAAMVCGAAAGVAGVVAALGVAHG